MKKKNVKSSHHSSLTQTLSSNASYSGPYSTRTGSYWGVTIPELKGICNICRKEIYDEIQVCELCGTQTCKDCMMILIPLSALVFFPPPGPSTIPAFTYYISPQTQASIKSMKICINCADSLKLSLRVASQKGGELNDSNGGD